MGEELEKLFKGRVDENIILETTVVTGFEFLALKECERKCNPNGKGKSKGRIFFSIPLASYQTALSLRSVDNVNLVSHYELFKFEDDKEKDLKLFEDLVEKIDWKPAVNRWASLKPFGGTVFLDDDSAEKDIVKFRVTCNRAGTHSFGSPDAACAFGGALNDKFKWKVDLSNYDLDVILNISDDDVYVALKLTDESLHRRNITHFSNLTLRSTICYCLLALTEPKEGDVIVDPMCGSGSIPIEGSIAFPNTYCFGGDSKESMVEKSRKNLDILPRNMSAQGVNTELSKLKLNEDEEVLNGDVKSPDKEKSVNKFNPRSDVLVWKAERLPLRDSSVDVLVTDLPFGKRSGNKNYNQFLYKRILFEAARIVRPNSGRAAFLTADKKSFINAAQYNPYWKERNQMTVNQGGIRASAFLLYRTAKAYNIRK